MDFPYIFDQGSSQHRMYRLAGFGLLFLAMLILPFVLPEFQVTRLNRVILMSVAILGLNLVVGYSGLLALCQSAFIAIGGFVTASLIMDHGWDYWMTIPASIFAAFAVGILIGIPALRIKGLYLAMATVAFAAAFPSLTKLEFWQIAERTGGANGREITEKMNPPSFLEGIFSSTEPARYRYFPIAIMGVLAFWLISNLVKARPGRAVIAIRDNETGAAVSGVDLRRFKVLNFGLSAALGGLAGVMWAMNSGFVAEQDYTFVLMVDLLVGLVVGGVGTISGAVLGAIVVVFGRWLCQNYFDYSLSSMIFLLLAVAAAMYVGGNQQEMGRKVMAFLGTFIALAAIGLALFAAVDIPGLYQLNGDGPLSQAIFGVVLIVVVFFAPQGIVGAVRKVRANFVQIRPVPPALPAGAESISVHFDPEITHA